MIHTKDVMATLNADLVPDGTSGNVEVRRIIVTDNDASFARLRATINGRSTDIVAGTYTALYRDGSLWMSDTPDERRDHLPFLFECVHRKARRVLINGLGLGMVVHALLQLEHVEHIDVVDIDPDVIALVWPTYEVLTQQLGKTVTIHEADAYTIEWPRDAAWDAAWHDIWLDISPSNIPDMNRLHRKYRKRVGFQDSWKYAELTDMEPY